MQISKSKAKAWAQKLEYSGELQELFIEAYVLTTELLSGQTQVDAYVGLGKQLHRLIDKIIAGVDTSEADCKRGCDYCCNPTIFVTQADVWVLNNFLKNNYNTETQTQITAQLQNRHELTKDLDMPKHAFYRCPFLGKDKVCSAYDARPVICRIHYSTDLKSCRQFRGKLYTSSHDLAVKEALQKGWAIVNAYRAAAKEMGLFTEMVTMEAGLLASQKEEEVI